jgi:hypothetical protein
MKIAYIFHGHARTWETCYQSFFDNIFNFNPGDVFIHTWNKKNPQFSSHWSNYNELSENQLIISKETINFNEINKIFKPKRMIIEDDPGVQIQTSNNKIRSMHGVKNMLHSSKTIFEEAKNYDDYDLFFSLRLDILWKSKLIIDNNFNKNILWCPILQWPGGKKMAWDVYMIGSKSTIDIKTSYLFHIDNYWLNKENCESILYEDALTDYLIDNKINFDYCDLQWDLIRLFK